MKSHDAPMRWYHPVSLLATWFSSGLLPKAPGTWGSLAALPPAAVILWLFGNLGLLVATLAISLVGIWASGSYARRQGIKDPGVVVIDEVAGLWLALLPFCFEPLTFVLAFVIFRAFDILKPWPISWADRHLADGLGIMADDILAGLYSIVIMGLLLLLLGFEDCILII